MSQHRGTERRNNKWKYHIRVCTTHNTHTADEAKGESSDENIMKRDIMLRFKAVRWFSYSLMSLWGQRDCSQTQWPWLQYENQPRLSRRIVGNVGRGQLPKRYKMKSEVITLLKRAAWSHQSSVSRCKYKVLTYQNCNLQHCFIIKIQFTETCKKCKLCYQKKYKTGGCCSNPKMIPFIFIFLLQLSIS